VSATDPVLARRARIARVVGILKRVGYLLLLGAIVLFAIAAASDFPSGLVTATAVALIGACVVLPLPIVLGYGLRAAEREDREQGRDPGPGGRPPSNQQ
jgi:predicted membrane-bound spermidine synthase